ncbi:MAG: methyltransferase domain-containing protein [Hyphomicrobiales bacterium]|nr:methyltransferase domain-containing protein [Hyphomicrobiales bacterium]MDE2114301.1 methyltransferase domain-containing protein [Hyphomicrobiales bacterium]
MQIGGPFWLPIDMRLQNQATSLVDLLHSDTRYGDGSVVLEVGCGVGAQTIPLAINSPNARFESIDISETSIERARQTVKRAKITNVVLRQADLFDPSLAAATYDHAFVCFVLEHLSNPVGALARLRKLIKPGGTLTVIEGDHGSAQFYPDDDDAREAIRCQVALQAQNGGDANIGRRLFPLLVEAGFPSPLVSPRMVYVDGSRPALIDGFTRKTFTAMIKGIREQALAANKVTAERFDRGIAALERTATAGGVFCYTFFKCVARTPNE